jgi:hypothetical protein
VREPERRGAGGLLRVAGQQLPLAAERLGLRLRRPSPSSRRPLVGERLDRLLGVEALPAEVPQLLRGEAEVLRDDALRAGAPASLSWLISSCESLPFAAICESASAMLLKPSVPLPDAAAAFAVACSTSGMFLTPLLPSRAAASARSRS